MTLRTRRIFFWSLIPCFVVGGAAAVFYSQGYRLDAKTHQATKVGALFVRGYPRSASITIDGKPLNTGSWWPLSSGTLDGSLAPGVYQLHAEAPGYRSWDAEVNIKPTLVTERKSLILFPEERVPVPATGTTAEGLDAQDAFVSPVILTGADNPRAVVGTVSLPGTYVGTVSGRLALTSSVRRGKTSGQILNLQAPDDVAATTVSLTGDGETVVQDDSVLHRESARQIAAYDGSTGKRTVFASSTDEIGAYLRTSTFDAWEQIDATSSQLVIRRRGATVRVPVPMGPIASIQRSGSLLGVLDKAGSLWLINPDNGTKTEVGNRAGYAVFKDDGSAVAAVIDGQIEVIPFKKDAPHGKLVGTLGSGETVKTITWYPDGEHLFVETNQALLFVDVIEGTQSEQHEVRLSLPKSWAYSAKQDILYVTDNGNVVSYVFPD